MNCDDKMWSQFRTFISTQKHWIQNQFQVIMGYIQLGKTDMAFEFIKRCTSEVEGTAIFTQLPNPEVGVRACLIWWKMRENNIALFPIIDKDISFNNTETTFQDLDAFMENLKELYFKYLSDKHVTWKLINQEGKWISLLKIDEDIDLPNLYAENDEYLGKVNVAGNCITFKLID